MDKKKVTTFEVYLNFRMKKISEEQLIRNHLNIYNLLRVNERNNSKKKDLVSIKRSNKTRIKFIKGFIIICLFV